MFNPLLSILLLASTALHLPAFGASTAFSSWCAFRPEVATLLSIVYDVQKERNIAYDAHSMRLFADEWSDAASRSAFFGFSEFLAAKSEVTALTKFYPENAGFAGATERTFLMPGQTIDRYGGSGVSRFFSPQGTADWRRSLPPGTTGQPLRTFEVVKPFEVESGTIAPWFNQPGGGLQYRSPVQLEILLKRGIIKEVTP